MWYSRLSSQSQLKLDSSQVINDPLNTKQCPEQCQVRRRCRHSSLAMSGCTWVSLSSFYRDSNQCLVLIVSQSDRRSYKAIKPGIVPGTPSQPSLPCPGSGTSPHLYCLLSTPPHWAPPGGTLPWHYHILGYLYYPIVGNDSECYRFGNELIRKSQEDFLFYQPKKMTTPNLSSVWAPSWIPL